MYTDDNSKKSCLTFLTATIVSLSILALGLFLQGGKLDYITPPFSGIDQIMAKEGLIISRDGTITSNSSSNYYEPQVTGMENPYYTDKVKKTLYVEATGYSSTVDQTNSEPFITASGSWVHQGVVAANFLAFGTRIRIPKYFGEEVFVVKDRMHKRYTYPASSYYDGYIDIWFPTRQDAINFGRVRTEIEILE